MDIQDFSLYDENKHRSHITTHRLKYKNKDFILKTPRITHISKIGNDDPKLSFFYSIISRDSLKEEEFLYINNLDIFFMENFKKIFNIPYYSYKQFLLKGRSGNTILHCEPYYYKSVDKTIDRKKNILKLSFSNDLVDKIIFFYDLLLESETTIEWLNGCSEPVPPSIFEIPKLCDAFLTLSLLYVWIDDNRQIYGVKWRIEKIMLIKNEEVKYNFFN